MIDPVLWKASMSLLSPAELDKLHEASLSILSKTGIVLPLNKKRYQVLQDHGCILNQKKKRVYFPREVIEKALKLAPASYSMCARNPENNFKLDRTRGHLSLDGTGVNIIDIETGLTRPSSWQDLCEAIRVADALQQISFLWPCLSAQDKPPKTQPLWELYGMLKSSDKHIQAMTAVTPFSAQGSVAIATVVAGGEKELKANPIISNFQCSISPLSYDEHALEAALIFAAAGIPVGFLNMQIGCATAPVTIAGNIAMGNAEILAGITFLQIFYPKAPTFYGSCATMMELKTGAVTAGGPDDFLLQAASSQLAHYYRLPANIGTFATGARRSGWHAGVENSVSGAVSQFCQADMMCGAGLTNGATVFSFEQLLMDCEIYDLIKQVTQGITITDETLALHVIDRLGPQNHFLTDPHTIKHLRQVWQPNIIDRSSSESWSKKGAQSHSEIARNKAKEILKNHQPMALNNKDDILDIITEYENK
jgi:trimethylamine---corrinoid protein Co-methyltransferase